MKGWVYIITNKALKGLVKVGFTEKDPQYRAKSLSNAAHPYPCIVEYEALVNNPREVESKAHEKLSENKESKEWFRCSIEDAIQVINEVAKHNILLEQHHYIEKILNNDYFWESQLIEWIKFAEEKTKNLLVTKAPEESDSLKNIRELNLCSSETEEIPGSIYKLENIEQILLMNNKIKKVPTTIGKLRKLNYLHLGQNKIEYLPEEISNLSKLETLYIQQNQLNALPENIGKLSEIKNLILFVNNISELPNSICELTKLEKLHLTGNKIKSLPLNFSKLTNLRDLTMDYNNLVIFPECLLELDNLEELSISNNSFERKKTPKIKDFKKLKKLSK